MDIYQPREDSLHSTVGCLKDPCNHTAEGGWTGSSESSGIGWADPHPLSLPSSSNPDHRSSHSSQCDCERRWGQCGQHMNTFQVVAWPTGVPTMPHWSYSWEHSSPSSGGSAPMRKPCPPSAVARMSCCECRAGPGMKESTPPLLPSAAAWQIPCQASTVVPPAESNLPASGAQGPHLHVCAWPAKRLRPAWGNVEQPYPQNFQQTREDQKTQLLPLTVVVVGICDLILPQMHQQKISSWNIMRSYRNNSEQKEMTISPETTEIYNLNDREFKIVVIRKLNELQENPRQFSEIRNKIKEQKEFFTKEIETLKKNQTNSGNEEHN